MSTFTDEKTNSERKAYRDSNTGQKTRVSYHSNENAPPFHFGPRHPMKPMRLMFTNHLVLSYDLQDKMDWYRPRPATKDEVLEFHDKDYVKFLESVTPDSINAYKEEIHKFNIGDDCPIFDGLYDYETICAGGTVDATRKLLNNQSDIAINWSGGLHHAKKFEASGFCYINDIVLGILNLLRYHPRVLYIDIDVHHGDGVQEAFYLTDRVMTLSFHKYDSEFFPGTGSLDEQGARDGKHFCLNVPLKDGIDDDSYIRLFKAVLEQVLVKFRPGAIVLQCGADSLGGDRLGRFNLNIKAHAECVKFTKSFGIPLVILGGGGYTLRNVSRLWAYETAVCLDVEVGPDLSKDLPFYEYFAPDYSLFPDLSGHIQNANTEEYLYGVFSQVMECLRYLKSAPSVQSQVIPPDILGHKLETEETAKDADDDQNADQSADTADI